MQNYFGPFHFGELNPYNLKYCSNFVLLFGLQLIFAPFNFAVLFGSRSLRNKGHANIKGFTVLIHSLTHRQTERPNHRMPPALFFNGGGDTDINSVVSVIHRSRWASCGPSTARVLSQPAPASHSSLCSRRNCSLTALSAVARSTRRFRRTIQCRRVRHDVVSHPPTIAAHRRLCR